MDPATEDELERLRRRVRDAAQAASRVADGRPPPRGYEVPGREGDRSATPTTSDLADLVGLAEQTGVLLAEVVRGLVPPELRGQFADALRELLIALRALLDFYRERLSHPREEPVEVQDIPIA
jgi:hypothetical protein